VSRRQGRRAARQRIQRASDLIPLPAHPYRDSAVFYAILAGCLVGVTYLTGGGLGRALVYAAGFFVIATSFSWWRFREKLARRTDEEAPARRSR
jgi:Flp pilus assembly protein TadB